MSAKLIKPLAAELLDDEMKLAVITADWNEFAEWLNARPNVAAAFDAWQELCAWLRYSCAGLNPQRN